MVLIKGIEDNINMTLFTVWSSYDTFNSASGERTMGDNSGAVQKKHRTQEEIKGYCYTIDCDIGYVFGRDTRPIGD